jgi:hypothetical protein
LPKGDAAWNITLQSDRQIASKNPPSAQYEIQKPLAKGCDIETINLNCTSSTETALNVMHNPRKSEREFEFPGSLVGPRLIDSLQKIELTN